MHKTQAACSTRGVGGTDRMVFAGPVLSHFEFEMAGMARKADSEWKKDLKGGRTPPRPEWTRGYLVPGENPGVKGYDPDNCPWDVDQGLVLERGGQSSCRVLCRLSMNFARPFQGKSLSLPLKCRPDGQDSLRPQQNPWEKHK